MTPAILALTTFQATTLKRSKKRSPTCKTKNRGFGPSRKVHIMTTLAQDLKTAMAGWHKIEAAAKQRFPKATKEEIYQITKRAMLAALQPN